MTTDTPRCNAATVDNFGVDVPPVEVAMNDANIASGSGGFVVYVKQHTARTLERALAAKEVEVAALRTDGEKLAEQIRHDATEITALREKLAGLIDWLDNNTCYYETATQEKPVLAEVSKRIWYHATDDQQSYPFSAAIDAARSKP